MTVEVLWEARWQVGGGEWQHLGYFANGDEEPHPVQEMVSLLVAVR